MNNLFDGIVGIIIWFVFGFGATLGKDSYPHTTANGFLGMF